MRELLSEEEKCREPGTDTMLCNVAKEMSLPSSREALQKKGADIRRLRIGAVS
jgi:hypothetical protein